MRRDAPTSFTSYRMSLGKVRTKVMTDKRRDWLPKPATSSMPQKRRSLTRNVVKPATSRVGTGCSTPELRPHMAGTVTFVQSAHDGACAPTDDDGQEASWEPSHIGGWGGT